MDMKKILQALDGVSTKPVEGVSDMKKFVQIVNEGANPHKVTLPVQMAMQHYQKPVNSPKKLNEKKDSLLMQYFVEAETQVIQEEQERAERIKMYAQKIAARMMSKK